MTQFYYWLFISGGSCDSDFGLSRSHRPRITLILDLNGVFHYVTCTIILFICFWFSRNGCTYLKCIFVWGSIKFLFLFLFLFFPCFFFRVLHTMFSHLRAHAFALSVTVARSSAVQASSSRRQERRWAIVCGSPQSQSTDWASSR